MQQAIIFHAKMGSFRDTSFYNKDGEICNQDNIRQIWQDSGSTFDKGYCRVGSVEVTSARLPSDLTVNDDQANPLEQAYCKSQNCQEPWDPVNRSRSTSVGDIILLGDTFYIVASFGFDQIDGLIHPEPKTWTSCEMYHNHLIALKDGRYAGFLPGLKRTASFQSKAEVRLAIDSCIDGHIKQAERV